MTLEEFIKKYQAGLKKYLLTEIPDHWTEQDLEDLIQDTWVKVVRNFDGGKYRITRGWVKMVAHSVIVDRIRVENRKHKKAHKYPIGDLPLYLLYLEDEVSIEAEPDIFTDENLATDDPRNHGMSLESFVTLKEGVENLPDLDRQVLGDYIMGYSQIGICTRYGLTRHELRKIIGANG